MRDSSGLLKMNGTNEDMQTPDARMLLLLMEFENEERRAYLYTFEANLHMLALQSTSI